ncbi:MAG: hypothetical protein MRY63_14645 [Neomegalonema sp.]|nr:hypothetical protein [Neomegalonema sp.]
MFSPLLQSVIDRHGYRVIDEAQHDAVTAELDFSVLLFAGDAERLAESDDVAIILPELEKLFKGVFTPLIVARESERKLQQRYRFNAFPALVFLRRGAYLGAVPRVLDWSEYVTEISKILTSEPSQPPAYEFPGCVQQPSA